MKLLPQTLLGRTALSLGFLMLVSLVLWVVSAAFFIIKPIQRTYEGHFAAIIVMARTVAKTREAPSSGKIFSDPSNDLIVVGDAFPRPPFKEPAPLIEEITAGLREKFGPSVLILQERDNPVLWIRFPVENRVCWALLPSTEPLLPSYVIFGIAIGIALSLAGAYLIIFRLTRQLRLLTAAVRLVGEGKPPVLQVHDGPREVRDLSSGFNQMSTDLKKLDDDRRLMLGGISHDLKTPLTRLRIAVELAAAHAEADIAAGMIVDIEDMDSILQQFLDYARDGDEEPVALADLDSLMLHLAERYRSRGIEIALCLGGLPPLYFRRLAMNRALINLIDNAVRYGRGEIRVSTSCRDGLAVISVVDQGPGIRTGDPGDFIKPFARESLSRSKTGAGLGLTIVDRVVRSHGGSLRVENRAEGGLLVRVELPVKN